MYTFWTRVIQQRRLKWNDSRSWWICTPLHQGLLCPVLVVSYLPRWRRAYRTRADSETENSPGAERKTDRQLRLYLSTGKNWKQWNSRALLRLAKRTDKDPRVRGSVNWERSCHFMEWKPMPPSLFRILDNYGLSLPCQTVHTHFFIGPLSCIAFNSKKQGQETITSCVRLKPISHRGMRVQFLKPFHFHYTDIHICVTYFIFCSPIGQQII